MIVLIYNLYIIYIFLNISIFFCICKFIELDINKYKNINITENNNIYNNFFDKYFFSDIYINIELGSNKQKIPLFLFHSRYELSIGNSNTSNPFKFNDFDSNSYNIYNYNKTPYEYYSMFNEYIWGFNASDKCKFSNKLIYNNLNFLSVSLYNKSFIKNYEQKNFLGLKLKPNLREIVKFESFNFINQLKINNLISDYVYYFKFNKKFINFKGKFIIGDYPHNINKKKYSKINLKQKQNGISTESLIWEIEFDSIKILNLEFNNERCLFQIENSFIIANRKFYNYIKENFFNVYINNFFCDEYNNYKNIVGIKCKKKINIINKFNKLEFYIKSENYTFFFDNKELFYSDDNYDYFLITFNITGRNWILGKIFFDKYEIIFNQDSKMFYWYDKNNKNNYLYIFYNFILIFVLIIIVFILIYVIYKLLKNKPRKKYANEMDDEYNFEYKSVFEMSKNK